MCFGSLWVFVSSLIPVLISHESARKMRRSCVHDVLVLLNKNKIGIDVHSTLIYLCCVCFFLFSVSDPVSNKLTLIGFMDPVKTTEKLQKKSKKTIELISPKPKKETKVTNKDAKADNKNVTMVSSKTSLEYINSLRAFTLDLNAKHVSPLSQLIRTLITRCIDRSISRGRLNLRLACVSSIFLLLCLRICSYGLLCALVWI